ncbi:MAG: SDR family oxidoreductase [Clostridiales bacterium]|nr:SDR family oxidoreductase [Clostridiales bacterium]MCF8023817.1 SDR family oxidoreductase [Clostridiales bacterium]
MKNLFDLKGKIVLVTGASSGLGSDAAKAYAEYGAKVALLARRKEKLESIAEEIKQLGGESIPVQCDVTNEEMVKNAVEEIIKQYGKIDILLNNSGVAIKGGVHNLTEEDWNKSMNTNVKGIYLVSKYVIPYMKEQNYGKVVNIASVNAVIADKDDLFIRHSYNASKSAVIGLTKGMAASYGKHGITVNAVGPALFESEITKDTLFKSDEFLKEYSEKNPVERPAEKGELNGTLIYLSSDASSYVNGQFILVDGGVSIV